MLHNSRWRPAWWGVCAIICVAAVALADGPSSGDGEANWPQWRGPLATGVAPRANPPVEWSETKHIRWKTVLPGKGHSTPIVWRDKVFVTAAEPIGEALEPKYSGRPGAHDNVPVTHRHRFMAIAVNRATGEVIWRKVLAEAVPKEGAHYTASLASASPVTDGEHVYAFFGSYGLFCLGMDGQVKWQTDLGDMQTKHGHGEGSSPVLYGDTLVVNWDHEGASFIIALDKRTGTTKWKRSREEVTSWATPIVVEQGETAQVVVSGTSRVRAYDIRTGRAIWECGGLSANIVASPVAADGMVFAGSSYDKRAMLAIRLDGAKGDITGSDRVVWERSKGTPYVPSPLLYGDAIYFLRHYQGILTRANTKTGADDGGPYRLGPLGNVYASPVGAAGRIYITDLNGTTLVITNERAPKVLAVNSLDDAVSASAAIAGDEIFLRGLKHLYCIARPVE